MQNVSNTADKENTFTNVYIIYIYQNTICCPNSDGALGRTDALDR